MSGRAPPGGASSIVFGAGPSDPAPTKVATRAPGVSWQDKDKIHDLVNGCKDVTSLLTQIAEAFSISAAPAEGEREEIGIDAQSPTLLAAAYRGFSPVAHKVQAAQQLLHECLVKRGCDSVTNLAKKFTPKDGEEPKPVTYEALKQGLDDCGCSLPAPDLQALFRFFDPECSGELDFEGFLDGLRPDMPPARQAVVSAAFSHMDVNSDGALTLQEVTRRFEASVHPDVRAGIQTEVQVLDNFLMGFDGTLGPKSAIVTPEKFAAYYTNVSAAIDDDFFALMVCNVWQLPVEATCRRLLVTHEDGTVSIEEVDDDCEVSREDLQEMRQRLRDSGVPVVKIALYVAMEGDDGVATSPVKRAPSAAALAAQEPVEEPIADTYKERMLASSVTFA